MFIKWIKGKITILLSIMFHSIFLVYTASAGVPQISENMITDVTPNSFSVIWISSEPSTADMIVSDSPGCSGIASVANILPHPVMNGSASVVESAENIGVMKVMVTGLQPDTEYCYQIITISKSTFDEIIFPDTPLTVKTHIQTTKSYIDIITSEIKPFTNDILSFPVVKPIGVTDADILGALLVVKVIGNDYPVTAFAGDGIISPNGLIDLNNLYDPNTYMNMNLTSGEVIFIKEYRGSIGNTLNHYRKLPSDNELSEITEALRCYSADMDCSGEVNIIDVQRVLNYFNLNVADLAFNPDIDIVFDGEVNILDVQHILNRFGQTEPF